MSDYDAGDPEQVSDAEKRSRQRERSKKDFLIAALQHNEGRVFFWDLLARCGVFRSPFANNALATAFAAGEQNIGLELLALIQREAPDFFATMLKENADG